ncbi:hypothetical protein [Paenibacillus amylolyticus]|uniref:hypothetical protein n=1 Tax=Paenibacillus amylolyticus TaxID=1451 RepID=UPI003395C313
MPRYNNAWDLRMEFISNYPITIPGVIQMIAEVEKDLNSEHVTISYETEDGFYGGIQIKIESPYLTYHEPRYADGGDSILRGFDTKHEVSSMFRRDYRVSNETDNLYSPGYNVMSDVYEFLERAKTLNDGVSIEVTGKVSERAATSWVLNNH